MRFLTFTLLAIAATSESKVVDTLTGNQCKPKSRKPTVFPINPFNVTADVEALYIATEGWGTTEDVIIDILAHRTSTQRMEIAHAFEVREKKSLSKRLKSELSGNFRKVITGLLTPLIEYYAHELYDAIDNVDHNAIIEILTPLSNHGIKQVSSQYNWLFNTNVISDVKSQTSGQFQKILLSLLNTERNEACDTPMELAIANAIKLRATKTDIESTFSAILTTKPYHQLRRTFNMYESFVHHNFEETIEREFSNKHVINACLAIVKFARNTDKYFAERLHKAMAGPGTTESTLTRILITRSEIDLGNIKTAYQNMYKRSLADDIADDTSDEYKDVLLALIGA